MRALTGNLSKLLIPVTEEEDVISKMVKSGMKSPHAKPPRMVEENEKPRNQSTVYLVLIDRQESAPMH